MHKTFKLPDQQQGAALIVGLVLMTVLTLLAVSTMRTSTLELAMAGNAQYREQAAQLADAGIADAVNRIKDAAIMPQSTTGWNAFFSETVETEGGKSLGRYEVTINYMDECSDPPSASSQGKEGVKADYFEIQSTGMSAARNAKSTLRQGFWKPAFACL